MSDAVAHLPGTDDPHRLDDDKFAPLSLIAERVFAGGVWGGHRQLRGCVMLVPAVERGFEFRQDLEQVTDKAVVRDLENGRFLVLIDGDNHF